AGVAFPEGFVELQEHVAAEVRPGPDDDTGPAWTGDGFDTPHGVVQDVEYLFSSLEQDLAGLGQRELAQARRTIDQPGPDKPLQRLDLVGHCRLRYVQHFARSGKASLASHGREYT